MLHSRIDTILLDMINPQNTIEKLDSINQASFVSDADRYAAKEAARRLLARLETPFERGWALAFEMPVLVAGLQIGSDLGIWKKWTKTEKENGQSPINIDTILSWCTVDVEPTLLREFRASDASE